MVKPFGVKSACDLPLTTARRRPGVLALASKRPAVYDNVDREFLQQVANQVAVAVGRLFSGVQIRK
jgi:formate hydrogenlyase transcriptional activator